SIAISYERGLRIHPPEVFYNFTIARVLGIPVLAMVTVTFTVIMVVVLSRTVYGRSIIAIGQNPKAARLVGIKFHRTKMITYILSALLASIAGALLASFSGGSSLDLGNEYLMGSIAVVILGGTNVAGGQSNAPGIWGAALFLYLLQTMLNTLGINEGLRLALTGLVIVAVIVLGGSKREQ
ncbi:MAG: ABC transporter permease, partial [Desulfobacterales bacterium]